jgi:hypothetical protein
MVTRSEFKNPIPSGSRATVVRGSSTRLKPYSDDKNIFGAQSFDSGNAHKFAYSAKTLDTTFSGRPASDNGNGLSDFSHGLPDRDDQGR